MKALEIEQKREKKRTREIQEYLWQKMRKRSGGGKQEDSVLVLWYGSI